MPANITYSDLFLNQPVFFFRMEIGSTAPKRPQVQELLPMAGSLASRTPGRWVGFDHQNRGMGLVVSFGQEFFANFNRGIMKHQNIMRTNLIY